MSLPAIIDQVPLIQEALQACENARARIEQLKAELRRFDCDDLPAYDRWYHSSFGKHLTQVRDLSQLVLQKQNLLVVAQKRHWATFFSDDHECGGPTPEQFEDARERLSTVESDAFEGEEGFGPEREEMRYEENASGYYDDEQSSYFWEDDDSVRRFEDLFVRRSRNGGGFYRSRGPGANTDEDREERARNQHRSGKAPGPVETVRDGSDSEGLRARIKARYRVLVRRLHPDVNPGLSEEAKVLWNQVQQAYRERNLEQLDVLLASSEALEGKVRAPMSIFQMRRAAAELERLVPPLQRKVDQIRVHRAWQFSVSRDNSALFRAIEKEFHRDLLVLRQKLADLDARITRFTRRTADPELAPSWAGV